VFTVERIRYLADFSVKRALAFAGLAIGMVVLGLSFAPVVALKSGAAMLTLISVVLFYKGLTALQRNVKRTELWILLDRNVSLPEPQMQRVLGQVLRETYLRYAEGTAIAAIVFWIASLVCTVLA
jgi:hypothetical protein